MSAAAARTRIWLAALAACALGSTCAKSTPPAEGGESNTNWLRVCAPDDDCGDGFSCVCGACTVACQDDVTCEGHGGGATCSALPASCGGGGAKLPAAACLAECTRDEDCDALEGGLCRAGVCARRTNAKCPSIEAGVQTPRAVNAAVRRYDTVTGMRVAIVDDSGVYYFDQTGALLALPHGADVPVMLRPAPAMLPRPIAITALVSDGSRLYWGEAQQNIGPGIDPPSPPGSLHAIAKTGGDTATLLEADDETFTPLGVRADRIVVTGLGQALSLVATDGSSSEPVAYKINGAYAHFMDGKLYWTTPWAGSNDEVGYFNDVFRADVLGSGAIEDVVRIEGGEFRVGHGFVVWWQERTHFDPLVLDQNLVVLDERTGCAQPLPGVGLSVSSQALIDDRHAYWHSYNGLGGVSPDMPLEGVPLLRADLRSGALERLVTDGYTATVGHDTIGQTADALYFEADGSLVVIDKPR